MREQRKHNHFLRPQHTNSREMQSIKVNNSSKYSGDYKLANAEINSLKQTHMGNGNEYVQKAEMSGGEFHGLAMALGVNNCDRR